MVLGFPWPSGAISFSPFGTMGEGGIFHGQSLSIGPGGEVFELDAFLSVGADPSVQLSMDPLPAGLDYAFGASLSVDGTDLWLTYSFTNGTGALLSDLTFLSYVDAQIDDETNGYFNEHAIVGGLGGSGDDFEIDEPGFLFGDIFDHLLAGELDDLDAIGPGSEDDVSMALSFALGDLAVGGQVEIAILLSEDGDDLGGFVLMQEDPDSVVPTIITYSGALLTVPLPEPGTGLLLALGMGALVAGRRGRQRRRPPGKTVLVAPRTREGGWK